MIDVPKLQMTINFKVVFERKLIIAVDCSQQTP